MASANIEEVAALKVLFNKQFDSEECNEFIAFFTILIYNKYDKNITDFKSKRICPWKNLRCL